MSGKARVCPICARPVAPRGQNDAFPFCTRNCKLVDLGRWFDGSYRMPTAEGAPPEGDPFTDES